MGMEAEQLPIMRRRGLLTERERELIEGPANRDDNLRYQAVSRARNKIGELATDTDILRENHPALYAELRAAVCNSEDPDSEH